VNQVVFEWNTLLPYLDRVKSVLTDFTNVEMPEEDLALSFV
jgi:hypothetical protein